MFESVSIYFKVSCLQKNKYDKQTFQGNVVALHYLEKNLNLYALTR